MGMSLSRSSRTKPADATEWTLRIVSADKGKGDSLIIVALQQLSAELVTGLEEGPERPKPYFI